MSKALGLKLRALRESRGLTLRSLAQQIGMDFTYLSKIENGKAGYAPAAGTIRALATALGADALDLLELAKKVPPELEQFTGNVQARRFFERAQAIGSPDDWQALLDVLESRAKQRERRTKKES